MRKYGRTAMTMAALALMLAPLASPATAQDRPLGEETGERMHAADSMADHERAMGEHAREMERHRREMARHARAMAEALQRAYGDTARFGSYWRYVMPDSAQSRFLYRASLGRPCARMGFAFTGRDTIMIAQVLTGSAAEEAGVRAGDVLVSVNGAAARERRLGELSETLEPGDRVRLVVQRNGEQHTFDVTAREDTCPLRTMLSAGPTHFEFAEMFADSMFFNLDSVRIMTEGMALRMDSLRRVMPMMHPRIDSLTRLMPLLQLDLEHVREAGRAHEVLVRSLALGSRALAGARLTDLNPGLAEYFETESGALVTDVSADTPAGRAGLRAGDVIVSVDGEAVREVADVLRHAIRTGSNAGDVGVELGIVRRGERRTIRLDR